MPMMKTFTGALLATLLATTGCEGLKLKLKLVSTVKERIAAAERKAAADAAEVASKAVKRRAQHKKIYSDLFEINNKKSAEEKNKAKEQAEAKESKYGYKKGSVERNREIMNNEFLDSFGNEIQKRLDGHTVTGYGKRGKEPEAQSEGERPSPRAVYERSSGSFGRSSAWRKEGGRWVEILEREREEQDQE